MGDHTAVKVIVNGVLGRMGRRMVALAESAGVEIVGGIVRPGHPAVGKTFEAAGIASANSPFAAVTMADAFDASLGATVCIDVSTPEGLAARAADCAAHGIALVSGTTGLDDAASNAVTHATAKVPVMVAANFSLGVALLVELTRQAVQALGPEFHVEIVELHHFRKADAPSGTALALANAAAMAAGTTLDDVGVYGRHGRTGERPAESIGVHAVRGGDVIGEHTVHFFGPEERLELTHRAGSRDIFVRGALKAARWIAHRAPGRYEIRDMFAASTGA